MGPRYNNVGWQMLNFGLGGTIADIIFVFLLNRPACWGDIFYELYPR